MKRIGMAALILVWIGCNFTFAQQEGQTMKTVKAVDLERYAGRWVEIAKIPNRFQKKCVSGTTAEYTLQDNGRVTVVNQCLEADGRSVEAKGVAKVMDPKTNARLQVSFVRFFGKNWFWGDYWIIGLDEEYKWAVIGHPKRKYGWILAREPGMAPSDLEKCHNILRGQGYNPDDFLATNH